MTELEDMLRRAAKGGIISDNLVAPLEAYLSANGRYTAYVPDAGAILDAVADPPRDFEDTEAPRFVRGFHDVLITIGVIVALVGLSGVASVFALIPAILLLSEVLVRRQHLALPAFVLTVAFVQAAGYFIAAGLETSAPGLSDGVSYWCAFIASYPVLLGLYYWRYRVPLALALTLISLFGLAVLVALTFLGRLTGTEQFIVDHRLLSALIFIAAALCLFAVAMRYDLSDPQRRTRRSDIAFWLHLGAAPILLYAMLAFVFLGNLSGDWWNKDTSYSHAAMVMMIVVLFMLVGLVIDRRAFVTSGLLSLGFAIWTILRQNTFEASSYVYVTILAVGIVVLCVGVYWQALRRFVMRHVPPAIAERLHAVH